MAKRALITGIAGQDGAYLTRFLLEKGYEVYGAFRRTSEINTGKLRYLKVDRSIRYVPIELLEFTNIRKAIEKSNPDEIYNLAAQSFVAMSFEQPVFTADVTALGPLRLLEAIRDVNPRVKFYQASSSEMYGKAASSPQNELTRFNPRSPYAISKLFAHWTTVNYREAYNIFACSGILFNHESPLRGSEFVTRKITQSVARIKLGDAETLRLGNIDARRDWGYAGDYVEAMWRMLQQDKPDDYVIATGESRSVREFVQCAFEHAGYDVVWKGSGVEEKGLDRVTGKVLVEIDANLFRPAEVDALLGDATKARTHLGWAPKVSFRDLVGIMVEAELARAARDSSD